MRVVYEAEHLIDAHLVRGALEDAGIPAWVRGEFLTGAIGELPACGLVAVCVPAAAWADAMALLAELWVPAMATPDPVAGDDGIECLPAMPDS